MHSQPKLPVDPILLSRAREMRHEPASTEQKLWRLLRARQLGGFKFRRQHPIGGFIADFYCHEVSLVIELDGDSHAVRENYDRLRSQILTRDGVCVIRFLNDDVHRFLDEVLEEILRQCEQLRDSRGPSPQPSPGGRGSMVPSPSGRGLG